VGHEKESFDKFLLDLATEEGAVHVPAKIDRIESDGELPSLFSDGKKV